MIIPKINLHQLVTFYVVVSEGSFTAASNKLCLTEPAVSQQIKALQNTVKVRLLYLKNKSVYLTEAGQTLFRYAQGVYEHASKAQLFINKIRDNSLSVGTAISLSGVVASVAIQFMNLFPNVNLTIRNGRSFEIVERLQQLEYDLGVVPSLDYNAKSLTAIRLSEGKRFVFVTGYMGPISKGDTLTLADLGDFQFIIPREGAATRKLLLDRCRIEGLEIRNPIVLESNYSEYCKMIIEMEKGITLMPESEVHNQTGKERLRIIQVINNISIPVDALVPEDNPRSRLVEEFIELTKQTLNSSP
jgi:DNA-binding transcriptional LysR family regulator